jgi:hypothetical protein
MQDGPQNGRNDPSRGATERWENEGGAIKDLSAKRADVPSQSRNENTAEMARPVLDGLADPSATSEQQESRKRTLLDGPKEFRDMRLDDR